MICVHGLELELLVPDEWVEVQSDVGRRWEHPSGLALTAKLHEGERTRIELSVLPAGEITTAPAPRAQVHSPHPLIAWLGGASAEIVAPTPDGPVFAQQRRGFAVGSADSMSLFPEPLVVAPGHALSAVWIVEQLDGDLLELPPQPQWLPERRHLPYGDELALHLPDAVVTGVESHERDYGHDLLDEPGLHTVEVGDMAGISRFEVGWHRDWDELVEQSLHHAPEDLWSYLALQARSVDVDQLDVRLAQALEAPTLWAALAAADAVRLGIANFDDACTAAQTVLLEADVPTKIALLSKGLIPVESLAGVRLGQVAYEGLLRFGLGRVMSDYPDGAERELIAAWFWIAGMGESPLAARIGGIAGLAQARALCRASETLNPEAVAWLSLFD